MISYIFYYNLLLQTFICSVLVILKIDDHYVISRVSDSARLYGWISINYMMIAMPLGMLVAKFLFSNKKNIKSLLFNYSNEPISVDYIGPRSFKYSIWVFTVISALACFYVFYIIGYFPFFKIFDVSHLIASELRITASREFAGNVYIKNFFALMMMPILSYCWLFYYFKTKILLDFFVFLSCFVLSISILYYDFSKSPMLWYLLSFVFVFFYGKGKVNKKFILAVVSIVIALIVLLYSFSGLHGSGLLSYNSGPVGRIILGQGAGLYYMFDMFDKQISFIGFSSTSQALSSLFNVEYIERAGRFAMMDFNPKGVEGGTAGVMNSLYIGEAWANFGILGVALAPLWVGFVIETLYLFFLKSPKHPIFLAFFVSFSFGGSITGGFNDYIYNPSIVLIIIFLLLVISLAHFIKGLK